MANLYLVSQQINNDYDTYDAMIACAKNEKDARQTDPSGFRIWKGDGWYYQYGNGNEVKENHSSWVDDIQYLKVEKIGKADKSIPLGVVLASFNAG